MSFNKKIKAQRELPCVRGRPGQEVTALALTATFESAMNTARAVGDTWLRQNRDGTQLSDIHEEARMLLENKSIFGLSALLRWVRQCDVSQQKQNAREDAEKRAKEEEMTPRILERLSRLSPSERERLLAPYVNMKAAGSSDAENKPRGPRPAKKRKVVQLGDA